MGHAGGTVIRFRRRREPDAYIDGIFSKAGTAGSI